MTSEAFFPGKTGLSVGDFFNRVSDTYDSSIQKAIPFYEELLTSVLSYCHLDPMQPCSILELGCGTGNLSILLREIFPLARLTLVDMASEMLQQTTQKLSIKSGENIGVESGFMDLSFPEGQFDLIISSLALHHLLDSEKEEIYKRLYTWLKPGGVFRCADHLLSLPEEVERQNEDIRIDILVTQNGVTDEEIAFWQDHGEKYDHYAPLILHFDWLKEAGFSNIDCYWRRLVFTVFGGQKALNVS